MSRRTGLSRSALRFALAFSLTTLVVLFMGLGTASLVSAESHEGEVDPHIKYRQKLMSVVGANMGAIGDIMKYQLVLPGHVESHAAQLAESAKLIAPAFRKQASEGPTDAKPEIWQKWSHFEEDITEFEAAARALESAVAKADSAAVGPAVKALGKTCGSCHKHFRKPKEESYKNQ